MAKMNFNQTNWYQPGPNIPSRDHKMIKHWGNVMKRYMRKKKMTAADWEQYHLAASYKKTAEETIL